MTAGKNVLISSAGRRVALLRAFERSAQRLDRSIRVLACDASPISAAMQAASQSVVAPRCTDSSFVGWMIDYCEQEGVGLIVPTIDTELPILAAAKREFASHGILAAVSGPETTAIGGDKTRTHEWLTANGFPTVKQATPLTVERAAMKWPVLAKPRFGSASIGIKRLTSPLELAALDPSFEYLLQEIAPGREHTVDVFVLNGRCLAAVPRERLEVRAGEVSKGVTRRRPALESLAMRIAESLPEAFGVLNIQIFVDRNGAMNVIEMNARFGGGFPLAYEAGADFPGWLMQHALGLTPAASNDWRENLVMLRYDDAVFVDEGRINRDPQPRL